VVVVKGKQARAAIGTLLLVLTSAPARADGFLTPFIGHNFGGDTSACAGPPGCSPSRRSYGVSVGRVGASAGFEEDLSYTKDFFGAAPGAENAVFSAMSNVLFLGSPGRVQSYILSGVGLVRLRVTSNNTTITRNVIAFDLGGGVNGFLTKHLGIRGDIRRFRTLQDADVDPVNGKLRFWRASLGLALKF